MSSVTSVTVYENINSAQIISFKKILEIPMAIKGTENIKTLDFTGPIIEVEYIYISRC